MTTTTAAALDPTRLIIAALAGLVILLLFNHQIQGAGNDFHFW